MPSKRLELTVSQELWDQMESARGDVPRAKWVKLALEHYLSPQVVKPSDPRIERVAAERERLGPMSPKARPRVTRPLMVRATSLVTPEIKSEWEEIMASRQARLNKHRDDAA